VLSVLTKPFITNSDKETSLIEEYLYPKYGPGQLWVTMAEEIRRMGGEIVFNTCVNELNFSKGSTVEVRAVTKQGVGVTYFGDAIFSSMPIKDLVKALGAAVPNQVADIASQLPYRDFITVGLLLKKLQITNQTKLKTVANIVPDCWIYVQDRDVSLGRVQVFNNWSPYMVADLENTVWIGLEYFCTEGDEKWIMADEDFIDLAIGELEKIGIIIREDVLDSTIIRVKKAYPAYFGTYSQFDTVKDYLNTIDDLYCIGRNGQHRYNNMDHSMLTAIEAVNCFLEGCDKEIIWKVNTEEEYHEKK